MRKVNNIFESKSSRILRCLLTNPGAQWSIRDLANEADISVGYTHAVTATLLDQNYIIRNEKELIEAISPIKLLERWASYHQYTYENKFHDYYTFENDIENVIDKLRKPKLEYALTTLSGAFIISPYVRPKTLDIYIKKLDQAQEISETLQIKPIQKDGNVRLVIPYDEGVFYKTQTINELKIVSNIQLYVDLKNYPARGEEAAQVILNNIKNRWSSSLLRG